MTTPAFGIPCTSISTQQTAFFNLAPGAPMDEGKKAAIRAAPGQLSPAFCYFYLVTTYGDVPLHLTFSTVMRRPERSGNDLPKYTITIIRRTSQDVVAVLPDQPAASGLGKPAV